MNSQISIIIFFSILFNYCYYLLIQKIETKINRKKLLIVFLVINIGTLMIFKYNNFFIENINAIFKTKYSLLKLAVPLGISFFTFQQISFLVDLYRNENVIRYPFIEYALHLLFFGWVTSGPIVRHNQVINQFLDDSNKKINYENLSGAFIIFVHGLFKKVIIADTLGKIVNTIYLNLSDLNSTTAFLFAFCYTLQIYFDFSGYSEIAAGIAKFLS
ncbi:D-alanyl-lipoteichoic acid acyltransferase DltB (MBOAT superfamily) [Faecalicoccus acidiformans]|uniref:D-alanyl-lipoteichoic acid acyltransferase DltB (MBOAT superfamily) n=1 Tax=Faecalicoccus acidiformans TaxID=915173 RepID=A0A7W8FXP8_9FIRM|nr:D-alanyl-lipoteichoic acid acyltransferase DltB (MBOAT superfamily) [Faecalicoccus acidiformans]